MFRFAQISARFYYFYLVTADTVTSTAGTVATGAGAMVTSDSTGKLARTEFVELRGKNRNSTTK